MITNNDLSIRSQYVVLVLDCQCGQPDKKILHCVLKLVNSILTRDDYRVHAISEYYGVTGSQWDGMAAEIGLDIEEKVTGPFSYFKASSPKTRPIHWYTDVSWEWSVQVLDSIGCSPAGLRVVRIVIAVNASECVPTDTVSQLDAFVQGCVSSIGDHCEVLLGFAECGSYDINVAGRSLQEATGHASTVLAVSVEHDLWIEARNASKLVLPGVRPWMILGKRLIDVLDHLPTVSLNGTEFPRRVSVGSCSVLSLYSPETPADGALLHAVHMTWHRLYADVHVQMRQAGLLP